MIQLGELVMILDLHRQGLTVSAIARRVGIDRKTVRKYIERGPEAAALELIDTLLAEELRCARTAASSRH